MHIRHYNITIVNSLKFKEYDRVKEKQFTMRHNSTADKDLHSSISPQWPIHQTNIFEQINPGADAVANPIAKQAADKTEQILFQRKSLDY